jgi:hypothetical protein
VGPRAQLERLRDELTQARAEAHDQRSRADLAEAQLNAQERPTQTEGSGDTGRRRRIGGQP